VDSLSHHVRHSGQNTIVEFSGLLDLRSVPAVRGVLLKCVAECPSAVVVDLTELTVTGPTVVLVFPSVQRRAAVWPAVPLLLAGAKGETLTALRRTSVARTFPIYADVPAALAAERPPLAARLRLYLHPTLDAGPEARQMVTDACAGWGLRHLTASAALVITELVENAAQHAATDLEVTIAYRGRYLHLSVADGSPTPPRWTGPPPEADAESVDLTGRGLRLVDAFASGWGVLPTLQGKTIWATLRTDGQENSGA
jgi:hypothetical protein